MCSCQPSLNVWVGHFNFDVDDYNELWVFCAVNKLHVSLVCMSTKFVGPLSPLNKIDRQYFSKSVLSAFKARIRSIQAFLHLYVSSSSLLC